MSAAAQLVDVLRSVETDAANDDSITDAPERDAISEPDTPVQAKNKARRRDHFMEKLLAKGIAPEDAADLAALREVTRTGQRRLPTWTTPCSPEMTAFFEGRSDEALQEGCAKSCRLDSGPQGTEAAVAKLGNDASAIVELLRQRVRVIRLHVVATANELRRRKAVKEGVDPTTIKYLVAK